MNVGSWHKPEFAESSATRSLPGDNRTFSNSGSTLHSATPRQLTQLLGAAVASSHRASDRRARRVPAALFGPLHPASGDFGCFLIQKL